MHQRQNVSAEAEGGSNLLHCKHPHETLNMEVDKNINIHETNTSRSKVKNHVKQNVKSTLVMNTLKVAKL